MAVGPLSDNPENTHQAILFYLKTKGEMTVGNLCEILHITPMAVRRHITRLQTEELVDCRLLRQARGRPTYKYKLTQKAEALFPSAVNNLAFELLDAVYEEKGHSGVIELLALRDEAMFKKLRPRLENLSLGQKVSEVAKIFSENGYMTQWKELPDGNFFIYQQHCAVHSLADKYRQICVLESQMIERLVGHKLSRQQYIMKQDPVCGYMIHSDQPLLNKQGEV